MQDPTHAKLSTLSSKGEEELIQTDIVDATIAPRRKQTYVLH